MRPCGIVLICRAAPCAAATAGFASVRIHAMRVVGIYAVPSAAESTIVASAATRGAGSTIKRTREERTRKSLILRHALRPARRRPVTPRRPRLLSKLANSLPTHPARISRTRQRWTSPHRWIRRQRCGNTSRCIWMASCSTNKSWSTRASCRMCEWSPAFSKAEQSVAKNSSPRCGTV
jgi:hypothetical protein